MAEQFATTRQPERDRWNRVKDILAAVLDAPPSERPALLDSACDGDLDLRHEVETLLEFSDDDEAGFIDQPAIADGIALIDQTEAEGMIGRVLDRYRIVEFIGEGGTGTVYRAVSDDVEYERSLAIKILKRGMDSGTVLRRFRDETRILARLDHPNIARFHEAGIAQDGRPYLVMEFLEGTPIHHYCREHDLSVREMVELFIPVCAAVEYSHRNLIIHRDLKASNILVTAAGVPKLLDFGIAKLMDRAITGPEAELTQPADRMLTPDYASPEQLLGENITTAADVYSLGVLLYEMLADRRPLQLAGLSIGEMIRVLQSAEVQRVSAVAPASRFSEIVGDLDVIVAKAMHHTPDRRYGSPEHLAEDLRRHLDGRPVLARPDSPAYRVRKFVSRNRGSVLVGVLAAVAFLAGALMTVWQSAAAVSRNEQAQKRFQDIRDLANGLLGELDTSLESLSGATAAREILARRVLGYLDTLSKEQDRVRDSGLERDLASAYERLGDILGGSKASNLGDSAAALECFRKSLAILHRVTESEPGNFAALRDRARAHMKYSDVLALAGKHVEALEEDQKAVAIYHAWVTATPNDAAAKRSLANGLQELAGDFARLGKADQALEYRRKVLRAFEELNAGKQVDAVLRMQLALAHKRLGRSLLQMKRTAEAQKHFEAAVAIERAQLEKSPLAPNTRSALAFSLTDLGMAIRAGGDPKRAVWPITEGLSVRDELVKADPKDWRAANLLATSRFQLGLTFRASGEAAVAENQLTRALEMRRELFARSPKNTGAQAEIAEAAAALADVLLEQGEEARALALYREASKIYSDLRNRGALSEEVGSEPARVSAALGELARKLGAGN